MRTLYYKVEVTQHLPSFNRKEIYAVERVNSGERFKNERETSVRVDAIQQMMFQFGSADDNMWQAQILEIIET